MSRHFLITAFPPTPESCRQALALPSTTRTRRIRLRVCLSLLLCAVLFSFQIMAVNHYGPQMDGVRLSLRQFFVVAVESSVAALLLEHPAPAEFAVNAVPLLYCGVMSSGVAYTLQILGQRDMNPAVGSLIMCLESVFSALGGWVLLHQSLSPREGVGCVLIFAAVVLAQLPAPQRAERAS